MFYQWIKNSLILILLVSIFGCENPNKSKPYKTLWYDEAATEWEEALPLGNGRLGVMVFGDPIHERIQLNDDSLWPDDLQWEHPPGGPEELKEIRKIIMRGDAKSADSLMVHYFSNKSITRSHQTLGDLYLNWEHQDISDYKRSLDLSNAISYTQYKTEGYDVEQKVFVSHPHQIMVISLSSNHPKGLNGKIKLDRPLDEGENTVSVSSYDQQIIMQGEVTQRAGKFKSEPAPILSGVKFETQLLSQNTGGEVMPADGGLVVSGVKELRLFIASNSDYYTPILLKKTKGNYKRSKKLVSPKWKRNTSKTINHCLIEPNSISMQIPNYPYSLQIKGWIASKQERLTLGSVKFYSTTVGIYLSDPHGLGRYLPIFKVCGIRTSMPHGMPTTTSTSIYR